MSGDYTKNRQGVRCHSATKGKSLNILYNLKVFFVRKNSVDKISSLSNINIKHCRLNVQYSANSRY